VVLLGAAHKLKMMQLLRLHTDEACFGSPPAALPKKKPQPPPLAFIFAVCCLPLNNTFF
jgi:hypothetical protein